MDFTPEQQYLDLLKKTLTYSLWPEPPISIEAYNDQRSLFKRMLLSSASRLLGFLGLGLVKKNHPYEPSQLEEGKIWPRYADTMIGLKRLDNIQFCLETVMKDSVEGDLIETGVWRGGGCIFMRGFLSVYGDRKRKVYVADSFQGLPKPNPERYPNDLRDKHHKHSYLAVSQNQVENNFKRYGLLDEQVVFLKGWFKDTLPIAPMDKLAILRLDGDMYESTMDALTHLYPKLSMGGFCIIDDYALKGCREAVDDFRATNRISAEIKLVDWTGVYWRKR